MPKQTAAAKAKKQVKPAAQVLTAVTKIQTLVQDQSAWTADEPAQLRLLHTALASLKALQRSTSAPLIPSRSAEDLSAFSSWLDSHAIDLDARGLRLGFVDDDPTNATLFATRPISAGDVMLRVPAGLALANRSASRPALRLLGQIVPGVLHNTSLGLITSLLAEAADPASPFAPYIRVLPGKLSIPYTAFSSDDMLALRPSAAANIAVNTLRAQVRNYTHIFLALARLRAPDLPAAAFSYVNWEWAVAVVMTRQNELPDGRGGGMLALVPVWDMCNHALGPMTSSVIVEGNRAAVELSAMTDFASGDQVTMFYGRRPNVQLLLFSGFVEPRNEFDQVPIDIVLDRTAPLAQFKARVLIKNGISVEEDTDVWRCRVKIGREHDSLAPAFGVAAVVCMDKDALGDYLKAGSAITKPLDESTSDECALLSNALESKIALYNSPLTPSDVQPGPRRLVAELHACELSILHAAMDVVSRPRPPVLKTDSLPNSSTEVVTNPPR